MCELKILKHALHHNIRLVRRLAGEARVIGVVKGNGYGLGLAELAGHLVDQGIGCLAVSRLEEALEGALELDRDWAVDPVTAPHLEAVFAALEAEDGDYLLPEADAVCLTGQDLAGLSADQLRLARNEIFARQGRTFQDQALQDYFDQQDWYVAIYTPEQFDALEGRTLNRYEAANLALIQSLEADRQG